MFRPLRKDEAEPRMARIVDLLQRQALGAAGTSSTRAPGTERSPDSIPERSRRTWPLPSTSKPFRPPPLECDGETVP
jgi:hypothetical protein